jgi:hypothetical protein
MKSYESLLQTLETYVSYEREEPIIFNRPYTEEEHKNLFDMVAPEWQHINNHLYECINEFCDALVKYADIYDQV